MDPLVPPDHEFVCLTFGPEVLGAPEGRPARELSGCGAVIHFEPPIAVDSQWRSGLGTFTIEKLEKTRFAVVASGAPPTDASSDAISEFREALRDRAYMALRGILMQGNPFEAHAAGLEISRTSSVGGMSLSASFMRPRTAHPGERILLIDDSILDTAELATRTLNTIFATTNSFDRLKRGLDHWDLATMEQRLDLRLKALVAALEALIASEKAKTQGQFVDRCKVFAKIPQADRVLNEIYELRSAVEHSNDWKSTLQEARPSLTGEEAEALAPLRCYQAELITRAAYLGVLLDPDLLKRFTSDKAIREFWSDTKSRVRLWGAPLNLSSEEKRCLNVRQKQQFDSAKAIEARTESVSKANASPLSVSRSQPFGSWACSWRRESRGR